MRRISAYRLGVTCSFERLPGSVPINVRLKPGVRVGPPGEHGVRRLYQEGVDEGRSLDLALLQGWCTLEEAAESAP